MKKTILLFFLIFLCFQAISQDTDGDTYTIQRLIIQNDKGEILLEQHKNGWMTPALRHNSKVPTNEGLKKLAADFGLSVSTPELAGIFMFVAEYKPQSSFRQHYTCQVINGKLAIPEGKLDVQWLDPNKAIEMMALPDTKLIGAVREMTYQILNYPEIIWGGTFTLWKENEKTQYKTSENFYSIAEKE